jgi:transposase
MRTFYRRDITRDQFELIRHELEAAKNITHPRKYDLYDIFCAVLYILKEGVTWRALPHDYPKWENVYFHYSAWANIKEDGMSLIDKLLDKLVKIERQIAYERESETTMVIIDSKTIDNADTAEEKGYDGGKKIIRNKNSYCG